MGQTGQRASHHLGRRQLWHSARDRTRPQLPASRVRPDHRIRFQLPASAARTVETRVPSAWLTQYKDERSTDSGGIAFSSRKDARAFYRGDWVIQRSEDDFERVSLARFGGLSTSKDSSLDGQWTLSGQDVFMRWDDGMRKILSPVGRSFVLYEYRPGRPLDGVPTRVLPAAPENTSKLAEHLEGREAISPPDPANGSSRRDRSRSARQHCRMGPHLCTLGLAVRIRERRQHRRPHSGRIRADSERRPVVVAVLERKKRRSTPREQR